MTGMLLLDILRTEFEQKVQNLIVNKIDDLKESEEKWQSTLENNPNGVLLYDAKTGIKIY